MNCVHGSVSSLALGVFLSLAFSGLVFVSTICAAGIKKKPK